MGKFASLKTSTFIVIAIFLFLFLAKTTTYADCFLPDGTTSCSSVNGTCQKNSSNGPFICYYQGMDCDQGLNQCTPNSVNWNKCVFQSQLDSCTSYLSNPDVGVESFCCRIPPPPVPSPTPTPTQTPCQSGGEFV